MSGNVTTAANKQAQKLNISDMRFEEVFHRGVRYSNTYNSAFDSDGKRAGCISLGNGLNDHYLRYRIMRNSDADVMVLGELGIFSNRIRIDSKGADAEGMDATAINSGLIGAAIMLANRDGIKVVISNTKETTDTWAAFNDHLKSGQGLYIEDKRVPGIGNALVISTRAPHSN
ncbi:MAG: hypothetical protein KGH98_03490 [Candidatus Micrarchaeota archaeon]|nr:hypothetical protein [Candidatus Micrarchaeota archaeon]